MAKAAQSFDEATSIFSDIRKYIAEHFPDFILDNNLWEFVGSSRVSNQENHRAFFKKCFERLHDCGWLANTLRNHASQPTSLDKVHRALESVGFAPKEEMV